MIQPRFHLKNRSYLIHREGAFRFLSYSKDHFMIDEILNLITKSWTNKKPLRGLKVIAWRS